MKETVSTPKVKYGFVFGAVVLVGLAFATRGQWDWFFASDDVQTTGAVAPVLSSIDDSEQLYRIMPNEGSSLTYTVEERLAGTSKDASGTTPAIAGDIAVNTDDPTESRVGTIVVNVELFESDSALRDKRIRHDFLESTHYPMAEIDITDISGIPTEFDGTAESDISMTGDLTLKDITNPVTFDGTVAIDDDTLTAKMTGTVLMSDYGIGPIHVAGLAHTEDEVVFELDMTAGRVDVDDAAAPDLRSLSAKDAVYAEGEFSEKVQPILESRCVTCHAEDGPGWNTLELDTAGKASEIAPDIGLVVDSRFMPPWPASDKSLEFEHDYSLTDSEMATIRAWVEDGGGLDVDPATELVAEEPPFEPIERDQVVPSRGAYVGDLSQQDDYRCLIHEIDDPENDGEWVSGIAFEPDEIDVVHHSIIYRVPAAGREEAEELDGADGKPGWECFGLANMKTPGVRSVGGWAPGQQARVYPDGVGLYLEPGDLIVNQIHYHFDHETPADQSTLVFDTISTEELDAREEPMTSVAGQSYLTPAEGPCTPEEEGPMCDRNAVLEEIGEKYGSLAPMIPDSLIRRCGGTVDDYDDLDGSRFSSSCDLEARDFGTLYSVLGHMHEFGDAYRMTLNPGTDEERLLLDIPAWSFEWQLYYVPKEQIRIEPGDTIRFECTWDRRNMTMDEPRYITWNEGTVDEMCFSSVAVVPDLNVEGTPNNYGR